jgi:hypothetical protein
MWDELRKLAWKQEMERDFSLEEAEQRGIAFCGDRKKGGACYKFVTGDSYVITYLRKENQIRYLRTDPLEPVT